MPGLMDVGKQAQIFWVSRTQTQKTLLLAGAGVTAVLLAVLIRLISTPDYKPLFTGLEAADAQTLSAQLDAEGIPHKASGDGKTISVPADKLDQARLQTASKGAPHSGRMGFELFDKMSWGQTEFDQKVTYQRALEGELEKTIETLGEVESARVHLVMATDSVFVDREQGAKASVILKLRGKGLAKDSVVAISRLVAGAVNQLKPEDVSITDADSARSLGLHGDGDETGDGVDSSLMQRLVTTLEPVVGRDKIRASVNVTRNQGSTEESQEKYDPAVSALLSVQKTEDVAGSAAVPSGVPGTTSNVPAPATPKPALTPVQPTTQSSKTESAQYGVNRTVVRSVMPAGQIQRVSAAILVDDAIVKTVQGGKTTYTKRKRTPDELNKIREIAEAVVGYDAKRGDSISVENMSFDADPTGQDLPAPGLADKLHKTVMDYSSLLRPVSMLALFMLAYLFVLRPIQKQALAPSKILVGAHLGKSLGQGTEQPTNTPEVILDGPRRAAQLKERTGELIKVNPINTSRALNAWLRED